MEEGEITVDFEGRGVVYGFGALDELVLAYAATIHKSQGVRVPGRRDPAGNAHGRDLGQAAGRAGRPAKGGEGGADKTPLVEVAGVAWQHLSRQSISAARG